jgi:hypothetical protein
MKTVGDLNLKPGDVVKREDGTLGVVVEWDENRHTSHDLTVWWHHETDYDCYDDGEPCAWEVVPKPVPTVASLGLKAGDVVRWGDGNWLVEAFGSESVGLINRNRVVACVKLAAPVPEGFRKVVTE